MNNDGFDGLRRPRHILMQILAGRGSRVLFVSSALNHFSQRRGKKVLPWGGVTTIANRLHWLQPPAIFRIFYRPWINDISVYFRVLLIAGFKQWFGLVRPVLFIAAPDPEFIKLTARFPDSTVVYNIHDRFLDEQDQWVDGHADMLQRADIVLCGSKFILDEVRGVVRGAVYLFPPAVDFSLFNPDNFDLSAARHGERHRVGCVGNMGSQIDWELLSYLTQAADCDFVFVGPVNSGAPQDVLVRQLIDRDNVTFLGAVPHDAIPALIHTFDVCILPYCQNEYTKGINPLKILEFLALGKAVISTPIPAMDDFGTVACFATTREEWLLAIASAIEDDNLSMREKRQAFVAENCYEQRADFLMSTVRQHESKRRDQQQACQTFKFEDVSHRTSDPQFREQWTRLIQDAKSLEPIYQSPEFFEFLRTGADAGATPRCVAVEDHQSGEMVGLIPVRTIKHTIEFRIGDRILFAPTVRVVSVLGSCPLIPDNPYLLPLLAKNLLSAYPGSDGLSMQAVPRRSALMHDLVQSMELRQDFIIFVFHGWREAHTIPLPKSYELYLEQFGKKKRYNLNRQVRLLREHGGGQLVLKKIETIDQVESLLLALNGVTMGKRSDFPTTKVFAALAANNLLLAYVLEYGGRDCAVMLGTRWGRNYHLHEIVHDESLSEFSPGTSILHLAIESLIQEFGFAIIDLGYGTPAHGNRSSNVTGERGHVLLLRKSLRNMTITVSHALFNRAVATAKMLVSRYRQHKKRKATV